MGTTCVKCGDLGGGTIEASGMPDCTGMAECTGMSECTGMLSQLELLRIMLKWLSQDESPLKWLKLLESRLLK
jgi:hypothetical protein